MKAIKLSFATALALLTVTALAGPSLARAESTALCSFHPGVADIIYLGGLNFDYIPLPEVCEKIDLITHVHESTNAKAKMLSVVTAECDVLYLGDVTSENNLGAPLTIIGHFTYTNCGSCTVEEKAGTSAIIEVLKLGHELADITGQGEVHIVCGGSINCTYRGEGLLGHGLGPLLSDRTFGEVTLEEQTAAKVAGGILCPKTMKLDILTSPLSVAYIAK